MASATNLRMILDCRPVSAGFCNMNLRMIGHIYPHTLRSVALMKTSMLFPIFCAAACAVPASSFYGRNAHTHAIRDTPLSARPSYLGSFCNTNLRMMAGQSVSLLVPTPRGNFVFFTKFSSSLPCAMSKMLHIR